MKKEKSWLFLPVMTILFISGCGQTATKSPDQNKSASPGADYSRRTAATNEDNNAICEDAEIKTKFMETVLSHCAADFEKIKVTNNTFLNPKYKNACNRLSARATNLKNGAGNFNIVVHKADDWRDIKPIMFEEGYKNKPTEFIENGINGIVYKGLYSGITGIQNIMVKAGAYIFDGDVSVQNKEYPCVANTDGLKKLLVDMATNLKLAR